MSDPTHPQYAGHVAETADRLRRARERHGVNAATVARLCGWSPQRVASLETGRTEAKARDIALYARITGADAAWLAMGFETGRIEVPDEPDSYAKPRGINVTRQRAAERRAERPTTESPRPLPEDTKVGQPHREPWRPAGIGRDVRPKAAAQ